MIILKIMIIMLLLLCLGLLIEKLFHWNYSVVQVAQCFRQDILSIAKVLLDQEIVRYVFDNSLADDLRMVAKPYSNIAFDIDVVKSTSSGTHFVGLHFIPRKNMTKEELTEVSNLLLLKFRRYLWVNNLHWRTFVTFKSGSDFVNVFLYYAERKEDHDNFMYRYRMSIQEEIETDFGTLQDDELNKEIENVN